MRAPLLAATLVALASSGCVMWGNAQLATDPTLDGPHFILVVQNDAAQATSFAWTLHAPTGAAVGEGNLTVPAGETVRKPIALTETDSGRLAVTYQWTAEGRAASGQQDVTFDARQCQNPMQITFVVSQANGDGTTFSHAAASCPDG